MFISSDRIIPPEDIFREFSSYVESNPTSQMIKEDGERFSIFTKKYCEICKRERIDVEESLIMRLKVFFDNPHADLSFYRDFIKSHPDYKISCLESSILIKDALESCNIKNSVVVFFANRKDNHEKIGHVFNIYWYRGEMFVCDTMGSDGPYMYEGYLSSVIPFKEYMYILPLIYENIRLFKEKENNFWTLNFNSGIMEPNDFQGKFSEIKITTLEKK